MPYLGDNKHLNNDNIHFLTKYGKNMTMFYNASFLLFFLYYETIPFDFFKVKKLSAHILISYVDVMT